MDRISFMQSIIRDNRSLENDIVDFFDHEMLLYELIGSANKNITVTNTTVKNISFHIDGTKKEIIYLDQLLSINENYNPMVEYDKPLAVSHNVTSDKSIDITISSI